MKYPPSISVGIAARNEEKTIAPMLQSVAEASVHFPETTEVEVLVGVNNSTDRTWEVAHDFIGQYDGTPRPIDFRLLKTPAGQTNTERALFEARQSGGDSMLFLSADVRLDQFCLAGLVEAMQTSPNARVTWATAIPLDYDKPSFRALCYNFADYYPRVVKRGKHFNGRAFYIRDYEVPFISGAVKQSDINPRFWKFLHLDTGPMIDDSYLSRATLAEHGPDSIVQVDGAKVYFQAIRSFADFYKSQRRKEYEGHRLNFLFPEYSTIRKRHFGKQLVPEAYDELPLKLKAACQTYRFLYRSLWKVASLEYKAKAALLELGVPLPRAEVWPTLASTKQAVPTNESS